MLDYLLARLAKCPRLKAAVVDVYLDRRERRDHPCGHFDPAGRFYASPVEDWFDTFRGVRRPTREWRYSYMLHARTRGRCRLLILAALACPDAVPRAAKLALPAPPDFDALIPELLLPEAYRCDSDAVALATSAYRDYVENYDDDAWDRLRWLVLADWLAERGFLKDAGAIREAVGPAVAA